MPNTVQCTVLFADLRGSTGLYETLGNAEATSAVTQSVDLVARVVLDNGGRVVKTLGDGLMAVFGVALQAVEAADDIHDRLDRQPPVVGARQTPPMKVQVALAQGEVVEVNDDCFGDAVNVAARLLDHAGDNETLATGSTLTALTADQRARWRRLDRLHLRGRMEPVEVWRLDGRRGGAGEGLSTLFGESAPLTAPEAIRLSLGDYTRLWTPAALPVLMGRSLETAYCVDDTRVSRLHARIEWHGGHFELSDTSSNGTFVRFGDQAEVISLRRSACTLHGKGVISLGVSPLMANAPLVHFEVLRAEDPERRPAGDTD